MSKEKAIKLIGADVKMVLVGVDSYMVFTEDLKGLIEESLLLTEDIIEVPFTSQSITALCDLVREHDTPVVDYADDRAMMKVRE